VIRYLAALAVAVPATILFSVLAVAGGLVRARPPYFDWIQRAWSRLVLTAAGVRVAAEGVEHLDSEGPQVLVANHQSLLDVPALFHALPVSLRFVAKMELSRVPLFGAAVARAGHVFIDRDNPVQAVETMRKAAERMKDEGFTLGLFPEGTRSPDMELRRFRRGPFVLAIETGTVLVPVAVDGGPRVLPPGERRLRPGTVHVRCGEPVDLEGLDRDDRDALLDRARTEVSGMLEAIREGGDGTDRREG
jgi:1-acyl-sn-glycerol-3-phosphate acyltransferase